MFKNINENLRGQNTINNIEENKIENEAKLNPEEPEKPKNDRDPQNLNDTNRPNILDEKNILFPKKKDIKNDLSNINENSEKKMIFKVIYRPTHDSYSEDIIRQSIITSFINFLVKFINDIIFKKLNRKDIFYIGHKIKSKIKLANILTLTVEKILTFQNKNVLNNEDIDKQIKEIKNNDSSFNKLFETPAIDLFKDIYYNEKKIKQIDLKKYGIEGLIFQIDEEIPTYEKLKEKFKDKTKLTIMDQVVQRFVNHKKFKIKKKK